MTQRILLSTVLVFLGFLNVMPLIADTPSDCSEDHIATELIMVCEFSREVASSSSGSSPCDASSIIVRNGNNCSSAMLMKIYTANLLGFNVPPSSSTSSYPLPPGVPDIYVEYDSDQDGVYDTKVGPISDFYYKGTAIPGAQGYHFIFEHQLVLTHNLDNYCLLNPGHKYGNVKVRLLEKTNGKFFLYDLKPFSGIEDVFSCEVFHETEECCIVGNSTTCQPLPVEYFPAVCVDCDTPCTGGEPPSNRLTDTSADKKTFLQEINPNPFEDQVEVLYKTDEEAPVFIEVIDTNGKVLQAHSLAVSIGEQRMTLNLSNLPIGVYYCKLRSGSKVETMKMLKLKD